MFRNLTGKCFPLAIACKISVPSLPFYSSLACLVSLVDLVGVRCLTSLCLMRQGLGSVSSLLCSQTQFKHSVHLSQFWEIAGAVSFIISTLLFLSFLPLELPLLGCWTSGNPWVFLSFLSSFQTPLALLDGRFLHFIFQTFYWVCHDFYFALNFQAFLFVLSVLSLFFLNSILFYSCLMNVLCSLTSLRLLMIVLFEVFFFLNCLCLLRGACWLSVCIIIFHWEHFLGH